MQVPYPKVLGIGEQRNVVEMVNSMDLDSLKEKSESFCFQAKSIFHGILQSYSTPDATEWVSVLLYCKYADSYSVDVHRGFSWID